MLKRNLWKVLLSLVIVAWAGSQLVPLKDTPFIDYARTRATAKQADFGKLLDEAIAMKKAGQASTEFVALKQIAKDRRLDLTQYFPDIQIERSLQNVEKRNNLLLGEVLRLSKAKLQLGLDLVGGMSFTLEAKEEPGKATTDEYIREEKLKKAIEIIRDRVNALGVAEPMIRPVGTNRIEVQLPNINTKDNPDVVEAVKKPARLDFRIVHPTLTPGPGVETPPGYEIKLLEYEGRRGGESGVEEVFIKRVPEMTGELVADAGWRMDMYGRPEVTLEFTSEGKTRFAELTRGLAESGQRTGRLGRLAIVLDGKLYSAPTVREEISGGSAQITGNFTEREAFELSNVLNNPLDVELDIMEMHEVGPSLAKDAIDSGVKAAMIGGGLVAVFMILYYLGAGLIAVVSVSLNLLICVGVLASLGATMTMPGIAGLVLTIGMAVDAHILIFERMREELNQGKSLAAAFHAGHEKAFTTIIDANLTTLIASGLMIALGTGPVKGFGVTLTVGIFATMFTALLFSRMLLEMAIDSGAMKRLTMLNIVGSPKLNVLKFSKIAFIASWIIVAVGLAGIAMKGHRVYGIDFAGGDEVNVTFKQRVDEAQLRRALDNAKIGETSPLYQSELGGGMEKLKVQTETGRGKAALAALQQAFPQAAFDDIGTTTIGPAIGKEIQWNAFTTLGLSLLGILAYVAFRFEVGYGVGAVVGTVHTILMTIGIFVLSGRQFTAPMVAAILLVVGYSINDTIVVFDRIREELKLNPTGTLREMINAAISKVFSRSILTSVTTLLAALSLYLFAGGVINDLAFTFIVGIVTGTFASIFIASPVFYWWHKGDRKHVEAHHDIAPKYEWQGTSRASE